MKHDACVARLEKKLSLDKQRVIQFLNAFVAGLVEELIEKGEVSVKGLGYFKVVYIPFRKEQQEGVVRALPPRKKNCVSYQAGCRFLYTANYRRQNRASGCGGWSLLQSSFRVFQREP